MRRSVHAESVVHAGAHIDSEARARSPHSPARSSRAQLAAALKQNTGCNVYVSEGKSLELIRQLQVRARGQTERA